MEYLQIWSTFWGVNDNISPAELAVRALVTFIVALILIRLSGMRPFGKGDAFDSIITFLMGGILSRGVVGATPFLSCIAGAVTIIVLHKIIGRLGVYSDFIGHLTKGDCVLLYKDGNFLQENMTRANISKKDVLEELRLNVQLGDLANIEKVYIERNGKISFVKKKEG